jgi:TolB-like protein/tetratricopeptide (TPR) repeat protein
MANSVQPENPEKPATGAETAAQAAQIFVSYSSPDAAVAVEACNALERLGHSCWIAPRDVVPGEFYADGIVRAIDAARVVLLVLSQHASSSPHVLREIERATSKRRAVLTLRIDLAPMPPALEYFLNAAHWLDASASGVTAILPTLVDAVSRLVGPAASSIKAPPAPRQKASHLPSPGFRPEPGTKSIAVLPFANMSAEPDQEYFSDGLAEEIINLLTHVPGLKVIARTSAFAFRGKEQDIRGIADALGVTHVLEGSVRRAGDRLRITGQLIHAADGAHLWSQRYDRQMSDIFAIQDEISTAIVEALKGKLSDGTGHRYTPNLAAYELYLKARHLALKVTPDSLNLARQCYEQAILLDDAFALPHIGLGYYWISVMMFGRYPADQAMPAARAAARKALQIDPRRPEAHALLGLLAAIDFDWTGAERHFDFPMAKQAGFSAFRPMYGWFQFLCGNVDQAIELARHAIEEDPLDIWPRMNLQAYLQSAGRRSEALEQLQKVLEIDEHQVVAMVAMAMIYADRGDLAQALAVARRANAVSPWYLDTVAVLAALLRRSGDADAAMPLERSLDAAQGIGDAPAHSIFHLLCGDVDQGADWAEKAIDERDLSISIYLRFVVSKDLRASLRWPKIAKKLNLEG